MSSYFLIPAWNGETRIYNGGLKVTRLTFLIISHLAPPGLQNPFS